MSGTARSNRPSSAYQKAAAVTQFGKYQLFASLGKGGMADVFLSVARGQMGFNKLAVVKRLRPALAEEVAFRNMFLDEARLAARLNHPNIVHTYEVGEERGVYFIAMEYLEGQSLNKVQKELVRNKQRMPPELAARIVADALAGLGHAHELRDYDGRSLNVIHRDVSPHNIFVTYDGHTKLMDFGIAKADTSSTETEVGILKGKVAYMSPEQAMGQKIDLRSDLFAMGIVLWELLAQQRLMTGENAANTLHRLMNEPIPHIADIAPGIDMELDRIVAISLEKDPSHRFQTAGEMRSALEAWLARCPAPARQEEVSRQMNGLFGSVRAEVQAQVQRHMANVNAATNTKELQALTQESLERMAQDGNHISGALMRLGTSGSGSGSGVIANYGGLSSNPSNFPSFPPSTPSGVGSFPPMPSSSPHLGSMQEPAPRSNALLIVITIGCFVLAALLIILFGWKRQSSVIDGPVAAAPPPTPSPTPSEATSTAPQPTAVETINAPIEIVSSSPAPAPAPKPVASPRPAPQPTPRPSPAPVSKPAAPSPGPAEEPGYVTVSSYPWAKVTENGKVICAVTPCNKIAMSPGTHTLTFENGETGQKTNATVQIKPGETTPKNIGFK
ncbi:MAG: serine/threonine protein kinase [Labilithrix sp.]|nr:serine/threonine protein kinase [Labilithrix sp.]MCW5816928.1 serine/threonine protein kinase [Labilithrix sp.]